jgi:predicted alpha-1,6-mannanase (GH76 family)
VSWAAAADAAQGVLARRFWSRPHRLYRATPGRWPVLFLLRWDYWIQAQALDATVDAVARTGSVEARQRVAAHVAGILHRNGNRIPNRYYDDMAWMALALLRAEEVAGVDTRPLVATLWAEIRAAWDEEHGGLVWRRADLRPYTNTPANAPSAILAARLHRRHGDPADLDWARRISDWLHATLVDRDSGEVWDGIHPGSDPGADRTLYTYNQGTVVGAEIELWRATGDRLHLDRARRTAGCALDRFADPFGGVLPSEGLGDRSVFKGILARYLGDLVQADPEPHGPVASRVRAALVASGTPVAAAADRPVGVDWRHPGDGGLSLGSQVSAVLLLEALAGSELPGVLGV